MKICGFNKTTLLDYPEHLAATVFVGGCNFRCPFCHNAGLVISSEETEVIAKEEVLSYLKKRRGILEGICVTGGEPTLQPDLGDFIREVKGEGFLVKLDTNGYRPQILRTLLEQGLLDYVAMDIKASRENYARAAGFCGDAGEFDISKIEESVELLKGSNIPYEFRTTVVKGLHRKEEFGEIGKWLAGSRAYYLQVYRENENVLALQKSDGQECFEAFSREEMKMIAEIVQKYIPEVSLRGIE